jgi:thymidine phosphorylase
MVPADKALYALRDVTGTVPSLPLIVASILSKKLAESLSALVLDVKFGAAAFMPTVEKARELAQAMVALGTDCGVNTRALLTRMEVPLGRAAGNWLEVKEAVACLEPATLRRTPAGNAAATDVLELVVECAAQLLVQTGKAGTIGEARQAAAACLDSGAPRRKWDEMLLAQGADLEAFNRKLALAHTAPVVFELRAPEAGFVSRCDARLIGQAIRDLGGGRLTRESIIDYEAGVDQLAKPGESAGHGAVYARVHAGNKDMGESARAAIASAFEFSEQPPRQPPLIQEVLA